MVKDRDLEENVFIIGIDGATFDIINPMVKEGLLPTFSRLMEEGAFGRLDSTIPYLSPPAWTSFMTGKNPGKHGILDFFGRCPDSYNARFFNALSRREKPFWTLLSESGKKVCVINVPMTYPPDKVNGVMISGMDTPGAGSNFFHPPSIIYELNKNVGGYILEKGSRKDIVEKKDKYISDLKRALENRFEVTKYLMEKHPWDLFVVVFEATDRAQHYFWKYMDPKHPEFSPYDNKYKHFIHDIYRQMDDKIGKLIKKLHDDITVIILSDHGFGPLYKSVRLNQWLSLRGYLSYKADLRVRSNGGVIKWVKKLIPSNVKRSLKKMAFNVSPNVNWHETRAFTMGGFGSIYINLRGREPCGIVEPGSEYEALRNQIMEELKELRDPGNGRNVIENVYKREEVYTGTFFDAAPDILISWSECYSFIGDSEQVILRIKSERDNLFTTHRWSGNHRPQGVLFVKGRDIKRGHEIEKANIMDVAPTALYLLGEKVPKDMDGKVLRDAISESRLNLRQVEYSESGDVTATGYPQDTYSKEESESIKEKLQGLGYID
jgi:predicted AlkP superfamily phosphohydrolase/phosphomutase